MMRRSAIKRNWRAKFLEVFRESANITAAARAAGVARSTVYDAKSDKEFARQFADAELDATDALEQEAWRRAVHGVEKPVYYKGEQVATVTEYSDQLLIVLLKARAPEKYRENAKIEHTGAGGGHIPITEIIIQRVVPGEAEPPDEPGEIWTPIEM
jgi:hypothetical protein